MMLGCKWSKEYHIFYFQDYVWIAFFILQTKLILNLVMTICTSRGKYSTSCIVTQTVNWHSCLNFKYLQLVAPQMTCIQQPIHLMPDQQFQELDEKEKIKGYWLIQYQILWTNTIKIIWQRVKKLLKSFTEIKLNTVLEPSGPQGTMSVASGNYSVGALIEGHHPPSSITLRFYEVSLTVWWYTFKPGKAGAGH